MKRSEKCTHKKEGNYNVLFQNELKNIIQDIKEKPVSKAQKWSDSIQERVWNKRERIISEKIYKRYLKVDLKINL